MIPPPNVTGSLHLGHALTGAIEDALTRWHRTSELHARPTRREMTLTLTESDAGAGPAGGGLGRGSLADGGGLT